MQGLLNFISRPDCPVCGTITLQSSLCEECQRSLPSTLWTPSTPIRGLSSVHCLGDYSLTAGHLVKQAKYRKHRVASRILSEHLCKAWTTRKIPVDEIVPVPQSFRTTLSRGFSLPEELANALSAHTGTPKKHHLHRKHGRRLASSRTARERHLIAMSQYRRRKTHPADRILLIDDVLTTGSTANTCARLLRLGGAKEVHCLTAASPLI